MKQVKAASSNLVYYGSHILGPAPAGLGRVGTVLGAGIKCLKQHMASPAALLHSSRAAFFGEINEGSSAKISFHVLSVHVLVLDSVTEQNSKTIMHMTSSSMSHGAENSFNNTAANSGSSTQTVQQNNVILSEWNSGSVHCQVPSQLPLHGLQSTESSCCLGSVECMQQGATMCFFIGIQGWARQDLEAVAWLRWRAACPCQTAREKFPTEIKQLCHFFTSKESSASYLGNSKCWKGWIRNLCLMLGHYDHMSKQQWWQRFWAAFGKSIELGFSKYMTIYNVIIQYIQDGLYHC